MSRRSFLSLAAVAPLWLNAHAFHEFSSLCLSSPSLPLVAGVTNISAIYDVSNWQQCRAFLSFAAQDFPTVTFNFGPKYCKGREVASFQVPAEVPNGEAYLIWECSGLAPTCVQASITQGTGNNRLLLDQIGILKCESVSQCSDTSVLSVVPVAAARPSLIATVTSASANGPPAITQTSSSSLNDTLDEPSVAFNGTLSLDGHTTWDSSTKADATSSVDTEESPGGGLATSSTSIATDILQASAVSRTSSTEEDSSDRDGIAGFPSVSSASRVMPGFGLTVFTLTQTVTTLLTTTTTLPRM